MTNEERLGRVLSLMFRQVKVKERVREDLRGKLFGGLAGLALTDDDLDFVATAGDLTDQDRNKKNNQEE